MVFGSGTVGEHYIVGPANLPHGSYAPWAHAHWVWLKNDLGNQDNCTALVDAYLHLDIPVGALNIDSEWATAFNNFEVDIVKFPDFEGLVKSLHDKDIRVTMWATSMVNTDDPDYQEAIDNKYLVRWGKTGEVRPLKWWHGEGGLLDYTNPNAVEWWHAKMDKVLDAGVDGFKTDGTDPYIIEYGDEAIGYNDSTINYRQYADSYYGDFFAYTREKRGDGLIMSRPIDCYYHGIEFTGECLEFSPKDVMYSGWVGDDDCTWVGLKNAITKLIFSAWAGYANFGGDIGGYRGSIADGIPEKELFIRWAQLMAFMPLMENGGGGEHRPWMFDDDTVKIYRSYVKTHMSLSLYLYELGNKAMESGSSAVRPIAPNRLPVADLSPSIRETRRPFKPPSSLDYLLGPSLFISPIIHGSETNDKGITMVQIEFPENNSTMWLDFWDPVKEPHFGGDKKIISYPLSSYPVFIRKGSYIPMTDRKDSTVPLFTLYQHCMHYDDVPTVTTQFRERNGPGMVSTIAKTSKVTNEGVFIESLDVSTTAHEGPAKFQFIGMDEPTEVKYDTLENALCIDFYEKRSRVLNIQCREFNGGGNFYINFS